MIIYFWCATYSILIGRFLESPGAGKRLGGSGRARRGSGGCCQPWDDGMVMASWSSSTKRTSSIDLMLNLEIHNGNVMKVGKKDFVKIVF